VIPVFLDETVFVGIPADIIGIKFKAASDPNVEANAVTDQIVFKLIDRLG
jgi:hypothetical protein